MGVGKCSILSVTQIPVIGNPISSFGGGVGIPGIANSLYNAAKALSISFAESNRDMFVSDIALVGQSTINDDYRKYLMYKLLINI